MDLIKHKLVAGQHMGPDYTKQPVVVKNSDGTVREKRRPTRTYKEGSIVYDKVDLEDKFGSQKFQRLTPKSKGTEPEDTQDEETGDKVVGRVSSGTTEPDEDETDTGADEDSDEDHSLSSRNLEKTYGKLDSMTLGQLKAVAKQEGLDTSHANTRQAVLKLLRSHEKGE